MNKDKLMKREVQVRIGGKGTARRKRKVLHKASMTDDKKLQSSLKKLGVNNIPGIEEVNMIRDDGKVLHFNNPKVQAAPSANTFTVSGQGEIKHLTEMLPSILNQLGAENINNLKKFASKASPVPTTQDGEQANDNDDDDDDDDDVPELSENFDEASKTEVA